MCVYVCKISKYVHHPSLTNQLPVSDESKPASETTGIDGRLVAVDLGRELKGLDDVGGVGFTA